MPGSRACVGGVGSFTADEAMMPNATERPHLVCGQCQAVVAWPASLAPADKAKLAAAARRDPAAAVRMVEAQFGLDERAARALAVHITRPAGVCQRCSTAIAGAEL